jgi:hypothetical protein
MRLDGCFLQRCSVTLGVMVAVVGCVPFGGPGGGGRPTCDAHSSCPSGWACQSSSSIGVCAAVIIPYPCPDTEYTCIAQGILQEGDGCLNDDECRTGLFCPYPEAAGDVPVCTRPQCQSRDDCLTGKACVHFQCASGDGLSCSSGADCGKGQYCNFGSCATAPAEGGNDCAADDECARGRHCVADFDMEYMRCTECTTDADCAGNMAGTHCNQGLCAGCNQASCGDQVCLPQSGLCVDCVQDSDCTGGLTCDNEQCRQRCDNFANGGTSCPSGYCSFEGYCSAPIGTSCMAESYEDTTTCGGSSCIATVGGQNVPPFCSRTCNPSDPPCPSGTTCTQVTLEGSDELYCVPN